MNLHGISGETVVSKAVSPSESFIVLKTLVPASSDYFDGHFPEFKLLPAVAQVDIVSHAAHEYLGTPLSVRNIRRLKFTEKILPDCTVVLKITVKGEKVSFEIKSEDDAVLYSSGNYTVAV